MASMNYALRTTALCASFALFATGCSIFEEEPIPFEVSRVVLPKDIPPPTDERNSYPGEKANGASIASTPESDLAARKAAAESQEKMHARSASIGGEPNPSELVKVKVPASGEGAFLTSKSFVTRWNILGPISAVDGDVHDTASDPLHAEYIQGEKTVDGSRGAPDGASWNVKIFNSSNPPGVIDFNEVFKDDKAFSAYYATACLDCPDDVEGASLLVASTIPVKIWLNGTLVHTYDKGAREMQLDQDEIEGIYLKKGYNRLVVKCVASKDIPSRKFMLRFATPSGAPIATEP